MDLHAAPSEQVQAGPGRRPWRGKVRRGASGNTAVAITTGPHCPCYLFFGLAPGRSLIYWVGRSEQEKIRAEAHNELGTRPYNELRQLLDSPARSRAPGADQGGGQAAEHLSGGVHPRGRRESCRQAREEERSSVTSQA